MNKNLIAFLIILIIVILLSIVIILDIFFFKFHEKISFLNNFIEKNIDKNNYYEKLNYKFVKNENNKTKGNEEEKDYLDYKQEKNLIKKKEVNKERKEYAKEDIKKKKKTYKKNNIIYPDKTKYTDVKKEDYSDYKSEKIKKTEYIERENYRNEKFHSYGEYISEEEEEYRASLIKKLIIKTIIIDELTKGNGISHEFFKVAYLNKMIPAKILEPIVESKEFRKLIPEKYLKNELKITGLPNGVKVVFEKEKIKDLLLLWKKGRLTPIQKAWKVKAEK